MALKQNKIIAAILLVLLFGLSNQLSAQDVENYYDTSESGYTADTETSYTDNSYYYYSDSAQYYYNNKQLKPKFDRKFWENGPGKLQFEEDTLPKPKKDKPQKEKKDSLTKTPPSPSFSSSDFIDRFKVLLIIVAILIILAILYVLYKNRGVSNRKVNTDILIDFDDLDEQTLKEAALDDPLSRSLLQGDYKTAYRIKYLQTLQSLVGRNMILYRKEKTNYEYLMELSGKPVYEPFRLLTFNFDGIWYGELMIDREKYESLQIHFDNFNYYMTHTA